MKFIEFNWVNRTFQKHFWSIWNFVLLLTEEDSVLKRCSTNLVSSDTCLLTVCLEKKVKVYIDNWISTTFKQKIWKIDRFYFFGGF